MTELDMAAFEARMLDQGFGKVLGARMTSLAPGQVTLRLPFRPELGRGDELVHGGVIAALIDKAGTAAAWSYPDIGKGARGATAAMNINFLEGAAHADLTATARVLRRGGALTVADVDVTDYDNRLIAKGVVTYRLSRPKSAA